jgi:hypothetical protein
VHFLNELIQWQMCIPARPSPWHWPHQGPQSAICAHGAGVSRQRSASGALSAPGRRGRGCRRPTRPSISRSQSCWRGCAFCENGASRGVAVVEGTRESPRQRLDAGSGCPGVDTRGSARSRRRRAACARRAIRAREIRRWPRCRGEGPPPFDAIRDLNVLDLVGKGRTRCLRRPGCSRGSEEKPESRERKMKLFQIWYAFQELTLAQLLSYFCRRKLSYFIIYSLSHTKFIKHEKQSSWLFLDTGDFSVLSDCKK